MPADHRIAGLAVHRRSHADDLGSFVDADETTRSGRIIGVDIQRDVHRLRAGQRSSGSADRAPG